MALFHPLKKGEREGRIELDRAINLAKMSIYFLPSFPKQSYFTEAEDEEELRENAEFEGFRKVDVSPGFFVSSSPKTEEDPKPGDLS